MKTPADVRGDSPLHVLHSALAFIALGANLGDPVALLRQAMERLQALSDAPLLRSSLWRSSPVDCPPGAPEFVNAVVGLRARPEETPESLLTKLQALETKFGRRRGSIRNAPRPLDLDLIAFGSEVRNAPDLTLPHPRAHRRRFVLLPVDEVAPTLILPGQSKTVRELLAELDSDEFLDRVD